MKRCVIPLLCVSVLLSGALFAGGKTEKAPEGPQTRDVSQMTPVDKNVSMTLTFLTHKQGMEDEFDRYDKEFRKKYPNVTVVYEPIADYKNNIEIRWTSGDWGDMCMIPHMFIGEPQLPGLFA